MHRPRISNIINFIRAIEPRLEMDLVEPVRRQIALLAEHDLPGTWLLQHDALISGPYVEMLKRLGPEHEIGGWLEIVQPLVERAGLRWRGRYPWDWHTHVGFSVGYTPAERERLCDAFMEDFRATFGRYPASVGSWLIDAHTLGYLHDRYGLIASCNCKDQWGTDGYTLWGGYWNGAYYPSRRNMLSPAQHASEQIDVPVFRMLGSDPIYQYDAAWYDDHATGEVTRSQSVVTLEPVCREGGGSEAWVRWYFDQMTRGESLSFAYTQVGQENSFGWPRMARGLQMQVGLLAELSKRGEWRVETLETSGRWFREQYKVTPASSVVAMDDWKGEGRKSVWFNSRFYRANFLWENGELCIRDIHKFDEKHAERYLSEPVTGPACAYDTLPVVDGLQWSSREVAAGIVLVANGSVSQADPVVRAGSPALLLVDQGSINISCEETGISLSASTHDWWLELRWAPDAKVPFTSVERDRVHANHRGHAYSWSCLLGHFEADLAGCCVRIVPKRHHALHPQTRKLDPAREMSSILLNLKS